MGSRSGYGRSRSGGMGDGVVVAWIVGEETAVSGGTAVTTATGGSVAGDAGGEGTAVAAGVLVQALQAHNSKRGKNHSSGWWNRIGLTTVSG
jgi:hypothetical protein